MVTSARTFGEHPPSLLASRCVCMIPEGKPVFSHASCVSCLDLQSLLPMLGAYTSTSSFAAKGPSSFPAPRHITLSATRVLSLGHHRGSTVHANRAKAVTYILTAGRSQIFSHLYARLWVVSSNYNSFPAIDCLPTADLMAEVLPPLVQTRPSSSGMYTNTGYRGVSTPAVQPYAFQATPHLRQDNRTNSAINNPHTAARHHGHVPSTSSSSDGSSGPSAKDDSVIGSRPGSMINLNTAVPDLSFSNFDQPVKSSPDRYRRPGARRVDSNNGSVKSPTSAAPAGSGMSAVSHLYQPVIPVRRQESVDDMAVIKKESELAKRYRRRSLNNMDMHSSATSQQASAGAQRPLSGHGTSATSTTTTVRPVSFQSQASSDDTQQPQIPGNTSQTSLHKVESINARQQEIAKASAKMVNVPPRGSSDANKRLAGPSPLSRQAHEPDPEAAAVKPMNYAAAVKSGSQTPAQSQQSPAHAQLTANLGKDHNKGMKSRLRRALSFGGGQELNKMARENSQAAQSAQQSRAQPIANPDNPMGLDEEQLAIARQQEAAGIGAGIYSGQGGFSGSTDNLSISSTASSASMMLRKMGRGAKKGARSIKGLFRPKSVIGVPAADGPFQISASGPVGTSVAEVSMVTVEAERHKVNVNAEAAEKVGGGTGFPKLERNSVDAASGMVSDTRGSADGTDSLSRRSEYGSERDRADVLAALKKPKGGILKARGTSSPNEAGLPGVPQIVESPALSNPATPRDGRNTSTNCDYFHSRPPPSSAPVTPNGSVRNISFSPRIQFHDVWSSTEYDRRGEIATCNRLTPMLAQQIKEELNTFKMVSAIVTILQ